MEEKSCLAEYPNTYAESLLSFSRHKVEIHKKLHPDKIQPWTSGTSL